MATFPALNPTARTYTPGQAPASPLVALNGDELSVRHVNASTSYFLRLRFTGLTTEQHYSITSHYMVHGRFQPFDLPTSVLTGANFLFPTGYLWIYARNPETDYAPGLISVGVELELVPEYLV
jgi:hypothetical protein